MFAPPTASPPRRSVCILEPYRVPRSMPPSWVVARNIRELSLTQPTPKKREREGGDATGLMIGGDEEKAKAAREGGRGASEGPNKIVAKPGVSCTALRLVPESTCYHAYTVWVRNIKHRTWRRFACHEAGNVPQFCDIHTSWSRHLKTVWCWVF